MWTEMFTVTCRQQAAGVRLLTWQSREIREGTCLLAHSPMSAEEWQRQAGLVICEARVEPADKVADDVLRRLPECQLVVADTGRERAVLLTRDGQRDVITGNGADLERRALLAYSWVTAGRPLATVP
jgi:hypothetical protein